MSVLRIRRVASKASRCSHWHSGTHLRQGRWCYGLHFISVIVIAGKKTRTKKQQNTITVTDVPSHFQKIAQLFDTEHRLVMRDLAAWTTCCRPIFFLCTKETCLCTCDILKVAVVTICINSYYALDIPKQSSISSWARLLPLICALWLFSLKQVWSSRY